MTSCTGSIFQAWRAAARSSTVKCDEIILVICVITIFHDDMISYESTRSILQLEKKNRVIQQLRALGETNSNRERHYSSRKGPRRVDCQWSSEYIFTWRHFSEVWIFPFAGKINTVMLLCKTLRVRALEEKKRSTNSILVTSANQNSILTLLCAEQEGKERNLIS